MIDFQDVRKQLTVDQVIDTVLYLGAETYEDRETFVIFPTICHNPKGSESSMKLYYYPNTNLFRCYTECHSTFDIFDLWQKVAKLNNQTENVYTIAEKLSSRFNLDIDSFGNERYLAPLSKPITGNPFYEFEITPITKLNFFQNARIAMWEREGITNEAMKKYMIKYYSSRNKVVIPHFNVSGDLIGIRGRNIEPEDLLYGKYMPISLEGKMYSHPLSFNLYGLNMTKDRIARHKVVYVFEGEKSVLKAESYFDDENVSVAACGSSFNKYQLMTLKRNCGVEEVIICFDREFETEEEEEKYFHRLYELCQKYASYCKMSFVFDDGRLTNNKDAPIDAGKETFNLLLQKRRTVSRVR